MIREIKPGILCPVHTEHKELFKELENIGVKVVYPKNLNNHTIKIDFFNPIHQSLSTRGAI